MTRHVPYRDRTKPIDLNWLMRWAIPEPNSGCMLWTATVNPGGYGAVNFHGVTRNAHRVAYMLVHGYDPIGKDIDHLCRVRCCVNPAHLEAVTRSENLRRGEAGQHMARAAAAKTHCPLGHPYFGKNLYVNKRGHRDCVSCRRRRTALWVQAQKTAQGKHPQ